MATLQRRPPQRALAIRLHPHPTGRRHRGGDHRLDRRPLPLPAASERPPSHHGSHRHGHLHPRSRRPRLSSRNPDRQRHGLHHPVRPKRPRHRTRQRLRDTAGTAGHHPEERSTVQADHPRQDRTVLANPQTSPGHPARRQSRHPAGPPSIPSESTTTPSARTALWPDTLPSSPTNSFRKQHRQPPTTPTSGECATTPSTTTARSACA